MTVSHPKTFISYAWEDDAHKAWVRALATRLRADGVDATLDQWSIEPGDPLTSFMESAVRENEFVLIVCTPKYRDKANLRSGGVGYEANAETSHPKGHYRNPLTDGEVDEKFRALALTALGAEGSNRVLAEAWDLENAATLDRLFESLVISRRQTS